MDFFWFLVCKNVWPSKPRHLTRHIFLTAPNFYWKKLKQLSRLCFLLTKGPPLPARRPFIHLCFVVVYQSKFKILNSSIFQPLSPTLKIWWLRPSSHSQSQFVSPYFLFWITLFLSLCFVFLWLSTLSLFQQNIVDPGLYLVHDIKPPNNQFCFPKYFPQFLSVLAVEKEKKTLFIGPKQLVFFFKCSFSNAQTEKNGRKNWGKQDT